MTSERARNVLIALVAIGAIGAALFTALFPAVEGLGTKVRLPVFHGAMTWVNLGTFTLMAVAAAVFLATRDGRWYRATEGLRWISVPVWIAGSVLGLLAALNTWDFSGSSSSPLEVAAADPRLTAQFWIMLAALGLVALGFLIDDERLLAAADVGFVAFMWAVLLRAILGPGRALHPDSPVMNSDELIIKALFFGIVFSLAAVMLAAAALISRARLARGAGSSE